MLFSDNLPHNTCISIQDKCSISACLICGNRYFTEYIVVFNGYYSTSARDGYVMAALDASVVNSWKIIPRHNPASDYPSDFSLVKVWVQ